MVVAHVDPGPTGAEPTRRARLYCQQPVGAEDAQDETGLNFLVKPAVLPSFQIPLDPSEYVYVIVPPVGNETDAILPVTQYVPTVGVQAPLLGVDGVCS